MANVNAKTTISEDRYYEEGNYGLQVAPLQGEGYGEVHNISGTMNIDITLTTSQSNTPADDEPDYLSRNAVTKAEGTIQFVGMTVDDYLMLYNLDEDDNGVVVFGGGNRAKKLGLSFLNTGHLGTEQLTNKYIFHSVKFTLPNITTQTISEDDDTIREFSVPFTGSAVNYTNSKGERKRGTYSLINSKRNADIWDKVKDIMYYPSMSLADVTDIKLD